MRILKALLAGAAGMFVFIGLFSLLIPSKVRVSRVVVLNSTDVGLVREQVANVQNWKHWHPIFTKQGATLNCNTAPRLTREQVCTIRYGDADVTVDMHAAPGDSIAFSLKAAGENDVDNTVVINAATPGSLKLEWHAVHHLRWYPWEKFYGIFVDKLTGPGYEAALNGLKEYIENGRPAAIAR